MAAPFELQKPIEAIRVIKDRGHCDYDMFHLHLFQNSMELAMTLLGSSGLITRRIHFGIFGRLLPDEIHDFLAR